LGTGALFGGGKFHPYWINWDLEMGG
jgi:hypothetical protein